MLNQSDKNIIGVVLAGGRGTRMRSTQPKPLMRLCGITLVENSVRLLRSIGLKKIVIVISPELKDTDDLQDLLNGDTVAVLQPNSLGTADALMQARGQLQKFDTIVVAPVDVPLVLPDTLKRLVIEFENAHADLALLTAPKQDPQGFGRVIRNVGGVIENVVEEAYLTDSQKAIDETNVGWYCVRAKVLKQALPQIQLNARGERFLTDVIAMVAQTGKTTSITCNELEALGANNQSQLAQVRYEMRKRILHKLMEHGTAIEDLHNTFIDADVVVGKNVKIYAGTRVEDQTTIGDDCQIGPAAFLKNARVGNAVVIENSRVHDSTVGDGVSIGPFSNVRSGSTIGVAASIGSNAEIKNSRIGDETQIRHFSYIGDAYVGNNVNIGAGAVTCNYDGVEKHETHIGDGAFIGSGAKLIAPVKIGQKAVVGAGAVVVRDVPSQQTVVGVPASSIAKREN